MPAHPKDPVSALNEEVRRVADRLRQLSAGRLAAPIATGTDGVVAGSLADAGHELAQRLADLAADLEELPHRPVPRLGDLAVGDQVSVTGADLVAALQERPDAAIGTAAQELVTQVRRLA